MTLDHSNSPEAGSNTHLFSISWSAIFAGAICSLAATLVLSALGSALGLMSVSPWHERGLTTPVVGALAIAWLIAMALFSSGLGGCVAGRLRIHWPEMHPDERYFRDTLHGFLVWCLGTLMSAVILISILGSAARGVSSMSTSLQRSKTAQAIASFSQYYEDMLFRKAGSPQTAASNISNEIDSQKQEARRLYEHGLITGKLDTSDTAYLTQLVAGQTGLSLPDASARISVVAAAERAEIDQASINAKKEADVARKAGVTLALWLFISQLIGAFAACYMATVGAEYHWLGDDTSRQLQS